MPKVKGGIGPNHRLRDERLRHGWTQQEVADRLGTTANNVSRWELGKTFPDPFFRARLCELFGISSSELGLLITEENNTRKALSASFPSSQTPDFMSVLRKQESAGTFKEAPHKSWQALYDPAIPIIGRHKLVGRAPLLQQLTHVLCETNASTMLALHGLPGAGKTALAIELAHEATIRDHFHDGILWAALGTSPHSMGVLSRWGTILGMSASQVEVLTDAYAWTQAIRTLIDTRHMLIILDDVWQSRDIQPFLVGGPYCAYLVTTRHPEVATRFAHDRVVLVEELDPDDGVHLLVDLAPAMLAQDRQTLLDLVQAVGGLPLALVLMGNYLRVHTYSRQPGRMLRAITTLRNPEERLKLAQPGDPFNSPATRPSPVVSLQTVIGVSDYALDQSSRQALYALACLPPKPNTFSEEAALAIADIGGETLDTLCDSGLLESRGLGRYTLHQTIADYARAQGKYLQAEERIIIYFMALAESKNENDECLERESENIFAAFQLACQHENWPVLVRGTTAFAFFLAARGMYPLVKTYLLQACQALLQHSRDSTHEIASVYFHLGRIADFQGAYREADELYAAGWEYASSSGDEHLSILLLAYWGEMLSNAGHYVRGEKVLLEGLQLSQTLGYQQQTCIFFKNLGEVAISQGNYAEAISYHQQGLKLAFRLEHWELVSIFLQNLAAHQGWHGDFQQAEISYRESLIHARNIGHLQRCSAALSGLGYVMLRQQRFSEAESCLQESLALARKIQSPIRTCCALQNLGILKSEQVDYGAAEAFLQESLDIATAIGHTWLMSETLYYCGELLLKQERIQEAQTAFERASSQAREQKEQELIALTTFGLARILWQQSKSRQAVVFAEESLTLFRKMEHEQTERVVTWLHERHASYQKSSSETFSG